MTVKRALRYTTDKFPIHRQTHARRRRRSSSSKAQRSVSRITTELSKVIIGQRHVIEELLVAMFSRGHCLLVGVPGLAKTLMIRTLAEALTLEFSRIQFTPDLMPADITGTEVIQEDGNRPARVQFIGPVFANVILADEINRTPPKTQAALLEAMQEHQVTVGGQASAARSVLCLGHAEPDRAGRHLPAARGAARSVHVPVYVDYPAKPRSWRSSSERPPISRMRVTGTLTAEHIFALADRPPGADRRSRDAVCDEIYLAYPAEEKRPGLHPRVCELGARTPGEPVPGAGRQGPRHLARPLSGHCEDVRAVALPVLRHRIMTNFNAEAAGIKPDDIVRRLTEFIPVDEERARVESQTYIDPQTLARLRASTCGLARSSKATSRESTKARITASRSSLPSTANTSPAMICATSIGRSSEKPTSIT